VHRSRRPGQADSGARQGRPARASRCRLAPQCLQPVRPALPGAVAGSPDRPGSSPAADVRVRSIWIMYSSVPTTDVCLRWRGLAVTPSPKQHQFERRPRDGAQDFPGPVPRPRGVFRSCVHGDRAAASSHASALMGGAGASRTSGLQERPRPVNQPAQRPAAALSRMPGPASKARSGRHRPAHHLEFQGDSG